MPDQNLRSETLLIERQREQISVQEFLPDSALDPSVALCFTEPVNFVVPNFLFNFF